MKGLNREARSTLAAVGITPAQWGERFGTRYDGSFVGDRCGCVDDRCIGFHHEEGQECSCLWPCIQWYLEA